MMDSSVKIEGIQVSVYTVPTETPESDGTFHWDKTSLVLVEVCAGGKTGLGYSYADTATARLIDASLAPKLAGHNALATGACWITMVEQIRNLGRPGIASMAIAAVDNALWDLKGKLLDISIAALLGLVRTEIMAYGSGGFTSYSDDQLRNQLGGWAEAGFRAVKMKIGRDASADIDRVRVARQAIGSDVRLFVDANGAYTRKQALYQAHRFREYDVTWFEEPVSSDDLEGLRLIRDDGTPGMDIAAGEYGYDSWYFRRMLDAGSVDVLQADATRRHHGISDGRRSVRKPEHASISPYLAFDPRTCLLWRTAGCECRIFLRSCANRTDGIRWRTAGREWGPLPRFDPARLWLDL